MIFSVGQLYIVDNIVSAIYVQILGKFETKQEEFKIMEDSVLVLIGKTTAIAKYSE